MDIFDLYAKIDVDLATFESGIRTAEGKFESFAGKIADISSKINNVGSTAFNAFGAGAAVAGAGLGAGLKYVIENGSAFEAQMSKVEAISGATLEEMEALSKRAAELGRDTKFSSTEAGQAYEYMAMAGWNTEQMLSGVGGIMDLAAASGEDLASTSDIVTDALTAFGLKAEDSTHFADVLAAASTSANTNVAMMGETFKYAAPLAGALGFSIEDVAGTIGLMANSGIKGTQAGTSLRSIFTRLASPVKDSAEAIQKLGVKITDSSGKTRKLNDIIADLRKGFAKLDETEQAEYASKIAGQEAMSGFLALMNAAPEDIDKVSNAIANADGKAKEMAETMLNNLPGAVTLFKSSLQSLAVDHIYSDAQDKLANYVMNAKGLIDELSEAYEKEGWSGIGDKLFDFADDGIKAAGKELPGMLESGGDTLALIFGKAEGLLSGNSEDINEIISSGGDALRNAFGGFVGLGKTAAKEFGGGLVEQLLLLKGDIFGAGLDLLGSLCEGIGNDSDEIAEGASKAMQNIGGKLEENLPKASGAFSKLLDSFAAETDKEENKESLKRAADNVINFIFGEDGLTSAENVENIVSVAGNVLGALGNGLVDNLPEIGESIKRVVLGIRDGISDEISEVDWSELGKKLWNNFWSFDASITDAFRRFFLGDNVVEDIEYTKQSIGEGWNNFTGWIKNESDKSKAFWSGEKSGSEDDNKTGSWSDWLDEFLAPLEKTKRWKEMDEAREEGTVQYSESAIGKEVASIVNSMLIKSQTEKATPTEVNLNIDGERVAQVVVDPIIKSIRQRDKGGYLNWNETGQ